MTTYPAVADERATLTLVLSGRSIARYGDGEFKLCRGGGIKSQRFQPGLGQRLREILHDSGACLVGIPTMNTEGPKFQTTWRKYLWATDLLAEREYVSAFITRPDSAPWIDTAEYWRDVESLWRGRDVTLVRGKTKSFTAEALHGAKTVTEIIAPQSDAWDAYPALLERIGTPERALLCLGPTATVMAVDLCAKGVHAIDCGHLGMFYKKHLRGEPMWVTNADKVA